MQRRTAHADDARRGKRRARRLTALLTCTCALVAAPTQSAFGLTLGASTINATAGSPFSGAVASLVDTGPLTCQPANYTVSVGWADQTSSAGTVGEGAHSGLNTCTYPVTASHTFGAPGTETFHVAATTTGSSAGADGTAHVAAGALITGTPVPVSAVEARSFDATVATFTDANPNLTRTAFSATVAWGDGTSSAGTITNDPSGPFGVFATHTYANPGAFTATVKITQGAASSTTVTTPVTVAEATLSPTGSAIATTEAAPVSGPVATFTDADTSRAPSYYAARVAWGDGTTSNGAVSGSPSGGFRVDASHTYAEPGATTATVTITEGSGAATPVNDPVTVADAELTETGTHIAPTEGAQFSGVVATFSDADPTRDPSYYGASVAWGDGTTSIATVSRNPSGGFLVRATHTYADQGTYTAAVGVGDPPGARALATTSVTVADAALSAVVRRIDATEGAPFTAMLATFHDADVGRGASHYAASVAWGDGTPTTNATIAGDGGGGFTVSASHTYGSAGSYATSLTIADPGGQTTASGSSAVADAPLTASAAQLAAVTGHELTATVGTFADADPNATPANYVVTVNWGDGAATTGATVVADPDGGFSVTAAHTYTSAGTFPTTVTINDNGGSTASASGEVTVADPPPPPPPPDPTPTPAPTPTPKAAPPEPPPVVGLSTPRLIGRSSFSLRLSCPDSASHCRGVARVVTLTPRARKSPLRGGTTLGSSVFVLGSGESRSVTIVIPPRLRKLLRSARSARVSGVAIAYGANGRSAAHTGPNTVVSTAGVR